MATQIRAQSKEVIASRSFDWIRWQKRERKCASTWILPRNPFWYRHERRVIMEDAAVDGVPFFFFSSARYRFVSCKMSLDCLRSFGDSGSISSRTPILGLVFIWFFFCLVFFTSTSTFFAFHWDRGHAVLCLSSCGASRKNGECIFFSVFKKVKKKAK